jgi:hypothetical protein
MALCHGLKQEYAQTGQIEIMDSLANALCQKG